MPNWSSFGALFEAKKTHLPYKFWPKPLIICCLFQVPRDPEDPQGAERQKEAQRLIDESEPLNEEEAAEKEQLLQEVTLGSFPGSSVLKDVHAKVF